MPVSYASEFAMSVDQIQAAVGELTPDELARFRAWFADYDADAWDQQIAADAESGRLDKLAEEALKEHAEGRSREL